MATSTTKSASVSKTASVSDAKVAELEKDLIAVVKELSELRKKVAACEAACKAVPAASSVDESKFVTRRDWSVWKAKVSKKIGLRR
jgi:phage shock protein A